MAENKTKPTKVSPTAFISKLPNEQRRKDAKELVAMMRKASGKAPKMWGPSIIGFGSYHYVYDSGREGDICRIGFSPRKPSLVLYLMSALKQKALMSKLGKHSTGKGCLYIKTLDDVDRGVLRQLIARSLKERPAF
jgi:Domain of unknown function (DU1801)